MQIPPIPPSVRTSAAGFLGTFLGWIALIPGMPVYIAIPAGALSVALLGGGLVFAADHRSMATAAKGAARVCSACGRPTGSEPTTEASASRTIGGPPNITAL